MYVFRTDHVLHTPNTLWFLLFLIEIAQFFHFSLFQKNGKEVARLRIKTQGVYVYDNQFSRTIRFGQRHQPVL